MANEGEGEIDTTSTNYRYAAYASRARTILLSAHRYIAYTSDVGESFRPVAHPFLVKGCYGISWAYLIGDVAYEGNKAYHRNHLSVLDSLPPAAHVSASDAKAASAASPQPGVAAASVAATAKGEIQVVPRISPREHYLTVMAERGLFQGLASMGLPAFTIHSVVRYSGQAMKNLKNQRIRTYGPIGLGLAVVPFLPYAFDKPVEHATEYAFDQAFEMYGKAVGREREEARKKKEL